MSRRKSARMSVPMAVLALVAMAAGLAGCGKMGSLERPGPMFGPTAESAGQGGQKQDPNRPVQTIDPRDPDLAPGATPTPTPAPTPQ